eukprot:m.219626 g.219626  ORF g.219626 m.219626 type:complete len:278 (+) comp30577_c0_seq1:283-1116(+)
MPHDDTGDRDGGGGGAATASRQVDDGQIPSPALMELREQNRNLKRELGRLRQALRAAGHKKEPCPAGNGPIAEARTGPSRKEFDTAKERILQGLQSDCSDNSKKGNVDAPIEDLLAFLNGLPDFVSTSSCSGRVAIYCETVDRAKNAGHWAFVSHDLVSDPHAVVDTVRQCTREWASVTLKCEPLVLHVSCATLVQAQRLMRVVLGCGYKNSGMLVGKRIMVGVRSTLKLDVPLAMDGTLMVSDEYILKMLELANEKMMENFRRTDVFFAALKEEFL